MRVVLDGLHLDTTAYAEGDEISFTFFSYDDDLGLSVSAALDAGERVLELRRGGENLTVRVREHEVTPPYSRRYEGMIHRHSVRLMQAGAAITPFPAGLHQTHSVAAAAR